MHDGRKWGWMHLLDRNRRLNPVVHSTSKYFNQQEIEDAGCRVESSAVPDVVIGSNALDVSQYVEYLVIPSWKNPRWMIPNRPTLIKNLGNFVKPSSLLAQVVWLLARLLNCFGGIGCLFRDKLFIGMDSLNKGEENVQKILPALYTGAFGPYQKFTVQLMTLQGDILEFWKIGDHPAAGKKILAEKDALLYLRDIDLKYNKVPSVNWYQEEGHYYCLAISPCLGSQNNSLRFQFSGGHLRSLLEIQQATLKEDGRQGFDKRLIEASKILYQIFQDNPGNMGGNLEALIRKIKAKDSSRIKVCLSHGDYSPWNVIFSESKACVFDWELQAERPILFDLYNFIFHAETLVYKKKGVKVLQALNNKKSCSFINELLLHAGQDIAAADMYLDLFLVQLSAFYFNYHRKSLNSDFAINDSLARILKNLAVLVEQRAHA
jgi:hypothetical protein